MKETLQQVSDATLEQSLQITVDITSQNLVHKAFQQWGVLPKKRVFTLRPIYLGTLIRISRILLSIDLKFSGSQTDSTNLLQANYDAIVNHSRQMAEIVALALKNSEAPVQPRLVRFILRNFTTKEMMGVLSLVLRQMDLTSFMTSIISVKGLNVLESQTAALAEPAEGAEVSL